MSQHPSAHGAVPMIRIEAFSDAVFAFAVTLLVVSLEVPKSAHELFEMMSGFVAFGICLVFLTMVWIDHARYFKRYPLTDYTAVALNMLLLFVVLLFVYPMKFLFALLMGVFVFGHENHAIRSMEEMKQLMQIYGLGFVALHAVLLTMHLHARRKRAQLHLDRLAEIELGGSIRRHAANMLVGVVSVCIARFTSDTGAIAGFSYFLIAPLLTINGRMTGRARRAAEAELHAAAPDGVKAASPA